MKQIETKPNTFFKKEAKKNQHRDYEDHLLLYFVE